MKILNGITVENYWFSEEEGAVLEIEKIRKRCIFKPLFEIADHNTKLILLDQIGEIGDIKELIFLDTIDASNNLILKKKVEQIKNSLVERLNLIISNVVLEQNKIIQVETDAPIHLSGTLSLDKESSLLPIEGFYSSLSKMPLSLTSLLETLKIKESPSSDILNIDFKLDSVNIKDNMTSGNYNKKKQSTSKSDSLLMKLLSQLKINLFIWIGGK